MNATVADSADPARGLLGGRMPPAGYRSKRARIIGTLLVAVWLLYLIGPVGNLVTHHYSAVYKGIGLAGIAVFCAIYLMLVPNWPRSPRYALPGVAVLAALAAAACVIFGGLGAVSLWIFVSSASGLLIRSQRLALRAVAGCIVCYLIFSATGHVDSDDFLSNLLPAVFIGLAMIGLRRQIMLTAELRGAREEVAQLAANEERLRLARDMHDLTGQSLSMITLKSELAARMLGRLPEGAERDRVRDEVEQIAAVSRQTLRDIREAISGYRRPTLAVEIITARTALASAGIAAHDDPELTLLSGTFGPDAESALAWCLREAITNVVRHSAARNCHITLTSHNGSMSLEVRDDGRGHVPQHEPGDDASAVAAGPATAHARRGHEAGTGLRGMSERLRAVGGSLEVRPDTHPGFRLVATVPVTAPAVTVAG